MAELLLGKNLILFFRDYAERATADASKLRFQVEHTISLEKESEASSTKDGKIVAISDGENTIEITSLAYREDDGTQGVWETLREYYNKNKLVEVWQVDASKEKNGKYKVDYFQGYFTSFEISAPSDDKVELTINYAINGNGVQGEDTLTADQLATVKAAQYEYQKMAANS